jgi:ABC-type branched-subunit amino acid transport system substrate-binding protein
MIRPRTTAERRRRRWRIGLIVLLVLVVAATLSVVSVVVITNAVTKCADGVEHLGEGNECVGLTDGSYVFRAEYADVERRINEENRFVQQQNQIYVTIAWLEPMTLTDPDTTSPAAVRHRLQGAYIAQHRANHPLAGQRVELPLVRLLLANPGSQARQWARVVDQIRDRQGADHLVAVAGLGQSLDGTRKAINKLAEYGIPMVGGLITADSLSDRADQKDVPGLNRVVPTDTDEVSAIVQDIKKEAATALLVQDTNPKEVYPKDIGDAFQKVFPQEGRTLKPIENFNSALGRTVNDFPKMALEICQEKPDVVFFAGRAVPLAEFLDALTSRPCRDQIVPVLTGDSATDLSDDEHVKRAAATGTTLEYTNLADPRGWEGPDARYFLEASTRYFREAGGRGYFGSDFPNDTVDDGQAVTSHDALWAAVLAARGAVALTKDEQKAPTTAAVGAQFDRMHGTSAVPGASGWISLDEHGNPRDKALTVIRVGTGPTVVHKVSSASGVPCTPGTPPC